MTDEPRPFTRTTAATAAADPVRGVHLGLGNFFRAHQAWYTHAAGDRKGIAAFTGRRPDAARRLAAQDGLYTLLVRDADGDRAETVTSISAAYDGADVDALCRHLANPAVTTVTLTITEAGYRRGTDGIDHDDPDVAADIAALKVPGAAGADALRTAPGRLVAGLAARRRADGGPIAVIPCDNLTGNGEACARVIGSLAGAVAPGLAAWIDGSVSFVATMVDRITPRTTDDDVRAVATLTGFADASPVVTEPFTEWVLTDIFRGPRPAWEQAGARFVPDVSPFELRKLWLLNGAHSALAYAGLQRGLETVAEAVADPVCAVLMGDWWDAAARHLPLPTGEIASYRAALTDRFANPRIRHQLAQIAGDGSQKLPERIAPVLRAERVAGRLPSSAAAALAGWISYLRGDGVHDPRAGELHALAGRPDRAAVQGILGELDPAFADDGDLVAGVVAALG